ncbi:MAG TPA: terminase family protein [Allosphingosinicella sp.]|jgi:phage terminase large subunit-like protein
MEVAGPWIRQWHPRRGILFFRTGAIATLFSGHTPELLRGPEHDYAWCDELTKWEKGRETWDMLQLGLRLGERPRALVITTPRPGPVLRSIMAEPAPVVIGGPSDANPHNSRVWMAGMRERYAGTRLERQELDGELLADNPGALWTEALLEGCRVPDPSPYRGEGQVREANQGEGARYVEGPPPVPHPSAASRLAPASGEDSPRLSLARPGDGRPDAPLQGEGPIPFTRLVIAVDPPTGAGTCGIIACARDRSGLAHLLADHSVAERSPEGWAQAVADAARVWAALHPGANLRIVAESNQGGLMVRSVLRIADPKLRVDLVPAIQGKSDRAAPVAMLFEAGRVTVHGPFPELEAQLCGMIAGRDYEGPGRPSRRDGLGADRADASEGARRTQHKNALILPLPAGEHRVARPPDGLRTAGGCPRLMLDRFAKANQGEGATYVEGAEPVPHPPAAAPRFPSPLEGEG